jgi:hypothetical protein
VGYRHASRTGDGGLLKRLLGPQQATVFDAAEDQRQKHWRYQRELD